MERHNFCPTCGNNFIDLEREKEDFGLIGRNDFSEFESGESFFPPGLGITDKLVGSILNSMMKTLDDQFKNQFRETDKNMEKTEIRSFPNGIKIITGPINKNPQNRKIIPRKIEKEQIERMNSLPRTKAKTNVKRLGNKIIYEILTPGLESPEDVFVSKLESGYEIKAIGSRKVYVNNVPINLPIKNYSIIDNKILVEFAVHD